MTFLSSAKIMQIMVILGEQKVFSSEIFEDSIQFIRESIIMCNLRYFTNIFLFLIAYKFLFYKKYMLERLWDRSESWVESLIHVMNVFIDFIRKKKFQLIRSGSHREIITVSCCDVPACTRSSSHNWEKGVRKYVWSRSINLNIIVYRFVSFAPPPLGTSENYSRNVGC